MDRKDTKSELDQWLESIHKKWADRKAAGTLDAPAVKAAPAEAKASVVKPVADDTPRSYASIRESCG